MLEIICLLLPIAAYSGWALGRRSLRSSHSKNAMLSSDYYVGLNFLLNEQPDKAVNAFIKMLDTSVDSVETTLALGNFFRRRGEVDRAIHIHQNLISKPNLTPKQRSQSLLELAQDYMRAGMYDRAESLLLELMNTTGYQLDISLRHLIDIYEREKDWEKAIEIALRLQTKTQHTMHREIAHYYCELAESAWAKGKIRTAFKYLKRGLKHDRHCARVSLIQGNFEKKLGRWDKALVVFQRIENQDQAFLPEALIMIVECYERLGKHEELEDYLNYLLRQSPSISIVLANAEKVKNKLGKEQAAQFLANYMHNYPSVRGLKHLIEFHLGRVMGEVRHELLMLKSLVEQLLEKKPIYRCNHCGFASRMLAWQCPSCRQWAAVKPIQGIEGE